MADVTGRPTAKLTEAEDIPPTLPKPHVTQQVVAAQALKHVHREFSTAALSGSCRLPFLTILPFKLTS